MSSKFTATKEQKKLREIIRNIPPDKKKLVDGLIEDASFMAEELEKLREYISKNGWSEEYQNGENQKGKKTSVEAAAYIKLQKSYASVIQQLTTFLPTISEDKQSKAGEAFAALIAKGRDYELR